MGYEPEETHYKLVFHDPKFTGLEVTAASVSVGDFLKSLDLATAAAEDARKSGALFAMFAGALVSWNVQRRGKPVPATYDGVCSQKLDFILEIVRAWQEAMVSVPPPLPGGSSSGGTSPELSLDLAGLSRSLPS